MFPVFPQNSREKRPPEVRKFQQVANSITSVMSFLLLLHILSGERNVCVSVLLIFFVVWAKIRHLDTIADSRLLLSAMAHSLYHVIKIKG